MAGLSGDYEIYRPKIFALRGRIGRFHFVAYLVVVAFLLSLAVVAEPSLLDPVASLFLRSALHTWMGQAVVGAPFLLLALAGAWRRLADLGHSGWYGLLLLVPVVEYGLCIYLACAPGRRERNAHGPAPSEATGARSKWAMALAVVFIGGVATGVGVPAETRDEMRARQMAADVLIR
ncbi:DUF805 domain-containing protein [Massilia glaciei]|uniref:DUF805 domain-containing protein n=2 Tax=Massilia glaciei TaxID=1524097 RepID=A0A2U2HIT9_9BURK|nr:DUF805 domain-containing protein [Massilia glaciei]